MTFLVILPKDVGQVVFYSDTSCHLFQFVWENFLATWVVRGASAQLLGLSWHNIDGHSVEGVDGGVVVGIAHTHFTTAAESRGSMIICSPLSRGSLLRIILHLVSAPILHEFFTLFKIGDGISTLGFLPFFRAYDLCLTQRRTSSRSLRVKPLSLYFFNRIILQWTHLNVQYHLLLSFVALKLELFLQIVVYVILNSVKTWVFELVSSIFYVLHLFSLVLDDLLITFKALNLFLLHIGSV